MDSGILRRNYDHDLMRYLKKKLGKISKGLKNIKCGKKFNLCILTI